MGMQRGSKWKRLAVFSDAANQDKAEVLCNVLRGNSVEIEWWKRTVPRGKGVYPARNSVSNLMRDASPINEDWLMVRKGDWPLAFVLAKDCGLLLKELKPCLPNW